MRWRCLDDQEHDFAPLLDPDAPFRSTCETCGLSVDECPACDGNGLEPPRTVRGEIVEDPCRECEGDGYVDAVDRMPRAASSRHDPTPSPPTTQ